MPKKVVAKKKTPIKKTSIKPKTQKSPSIDKSLAENFIALQKIMTHLATRFDSLSTQISKLLELFEISAKTLAKKDIALNTGKEDTKMVEKLDTLLDQNKILARSLTLLHEGSIPSANPQPTPQQPKPPAQFQPPAVSKPLNTDGYQKSMSIKNPGQPTQKYRTMRNG